MHITSIYRITITFRKNFVKTLLNYPGQTENMKHEIRMNSPLKEN